MDVMILQSPVGRFSGITGPTSTGGNYLFLSATERGAVDVVKRREELNRARSARRTTSSARFAAMKTTARVRERVAAEAHYTPANPRSGRLLAFPPV